MPHRNYYLDICVTAFIVHRGKIMLGLHTKSNQMLPPGGHVEDGETFEHALLREVFEETNMPVHILQPPGFEAFHDEHASQCIPPIFVDHHRVNDHHKHQALCYLCRPDEHRKLRPHFAQSSEFEHLDFYGVWQLDEMLNQQQPGKIMPSVYQYCRAALRLEMTYTETGPPTESPLFSKTAKTVHELDADLVDTN